MNPPPSAEPSTRIQGGASAFRHRGYLFYWLSRFLATFSTQIVSVAVGWQVYDLTRDPFDLGLVGLVQFLPALLLVLVTGAAADHFNRRLIMALCQAVEAVCCAALLVLVWTRHGSVMPIFAVLGPLRCGARLSRPGAIIARPQSRAAGRSEQCDRVEFVGLAGRDHSRTGGGRPALRAQRRGGLWHGACADVRRVLPCPACAEAAAEDLDPGDEP